MKKRKVQQKKALKVFLHQKHIRHADNLFYSKTSVNKKQEQMVVQQKKM